MEKLKAAESPRSYYKVFEITENDGERVVLEGTELVLLGHDIAGRLDGCSHCILLAVTIGLEADRLINRTQLTNLGKAFEYDMQAGLDVEEYCNEVNRELEVKYAEKGFALVERYSPGYGDMPLVQSREICEELETQKRIGVWINEGGMMVPFKSISAVIGMKKGE